MRYVLKVTSKALPGRHDEYDRWYADTHLPEVLGKVPGYIACTRFVSVAGEDVRPEFTALYEVEADSPETVTRVLREAAPGFSVTDSLDRTCVTQEVLLPLPGSRQTRAAN